MTPALPPPPPPPPPLSTSLLIILHLFYWTQWFINYHKGQGKIFRPSHRHTSIKLGKLPVPERPTIWMIVGQWPIALAVGAGGGCLGVFALLYPFSPFSPSLWETARYKLKYCLKGPLNPNQQQQLNQTICSRVKKLDDYQRNEEIMPQSN